MGKPSFDEAVEFAGKRRAELFAPDSLPFHLMETAWNPSVWDEVNATAQQLLRKHAPIPDMLAEWVADVLAGKEERKRPKRQGKKRMDPVQGRAIIDVIEALVDKGFQSTRGLESRRISSGGEAACEAGGTACDVVGVAFNMKYKDVENVWGRFKRQEKGGPFIEFQKNPEYAG